jgi:hypothetical protein
VCNQIYNPAREQRYEEEETWKVTREEGMQPNGAEEEGGEEGRRLETKRK